jgi:hypothetical protein
MQALSHKLPQSQIFDSPLLNQTKFLVKGKIILIFSQKIDPVSSGFTINTKNTNYDTIAEAVDDSLSDSVMKR